MDADTLDPLDRQLLHALHLDGRAPFATIANVLGVSDRTVGRRVARLRATGAARVTAVVDNRATGSADWLVRLRVMPSGAGALARALAGRPDTSWVTVLSSGTEIVCLVRAPAGAPAPLETLTRHPHIRDAYAHRVLRHLMNRRWAGRTSALSDDQAAALQAPLSDNAAPIALNDLDRRLLPALAADGRAGYPHLARSVGWSESAVRRRLEDLRRSGAVRFDVEADPALFGFSTQCLLWLTVAPPRLAVVAQAVAGDTETAFVGAITGAANLLVIAVCRDETALYAYLSDRIGALRGVERVETAPITAYAKRVVPALP
ncbi:Lrp/AsnC family transcriptional regulator [Cryptosporangium minutisporangium]|uniref:Lrp/AsnC family transcriptional regulator n=1 Tax=Cryptosporangium minutisporangium TaxID=113569 RepID=A0ABP6T0I8_9ACTN